MTQTPKRKLKAGDPVMLPSGLVTKLTDIQYEHNRYQLLEAANGWQYGIENLQLADWEKEARKCRREALRQYPTPEAYEAACAARDKHQKRADVAERKEEKLKEALEHCVREYPLWEIKTIYAEMMQDYLQNVLTVLYPDTPAPKEGSS